MPWWGLCAMGGLGALALDLAEIARYIQRQGHPPWRSWDRPGAEDRTGQPLPRLSIFCLAVLLKFLTGLSVAGALAAGNQIESPFTGLLLGAGAGSILCRAAGQAALPERPAIDLTEDFSDHPARPRAADHG